MEEIQVKAEAKDAGERLDKFLVGALAKKFSRTFIKKLIDGAHVTVNRSRTNAHQRVSEGDLIMVTIPEPKVMELLPENIPLEVAYEDSDLMVVNKPPGVSVHPSGAHLKGTLVNHLLFHCVGLSGIGGVLRPGIVHRLDKETSGLLVVAKNDRVHINLSNQFKNRKTKRYYIALARGCVQLDNGRIELAIARKKKDVTKMGVSFAGENRKNAITNYKVLERLKGFTVLSLSLETGRTHQIRVHLAYLGHPVIGDKLYGSAKGLNRQALHAKTLGFFHPATKKFMEFDSEIPRDMADLIAKGEL